MVMNPQYHPVYGGASATQNQPYGQNAPYGMNQPYGQNAPYGMNQPYGQNAPYGVNQPYGQNAPYGMNQPYGQNAPYGMNQPYGQNAPYGMNQPYGQNAPYGMNQPYEQNAPYGMNQPYGQNAPYGMNQPYGQNAPYGMNQPYGQNAPYGMNQPYGQNAPYGVNPPHEIAPAYGANLPCEVNPPFGGAVSHGVPAVYTPTWQQGVIEPYQSPYRFIPNDPKHTEGGAKEGINQLLWFSIAGIMIAAFLAIMIGIAIHDDGTGMNVSEAFSSWIAGFSAKEENEEENPPAVSFMTESSETIRGDLFAVGEDGSVFVRTEYGVCRVAKSGDGYEYNGWAAELAPDVTVRSMAVYGDYLYLACGENGIYRVNVARSNTFSQIIDDNVKSFVIAEDNLFYIAMDHLDMGRGDSYVDSWGKLYIAGLNGKGQRSLNEKVFCNSKYLSSADFVYVDGYLYYFDQNENLKRMRADGTGSRVVVERERQKPSFSSCGLYENGGILYLPSRNGGIYSYDVETDKLKKVTDSAISPRSPILFVGNALLYKEETEFVWHQIREGQDTVYASPLNDAELWMQAVGTGELFAFYEPNNYYSVSFWGGNIHAEDYLEIDYETMPEVDIEEGQDVLLQGTEQEDCRAEQFVFVGPNGDSVYEHYIIFMYPGYNEISGESVGPLIWIYEDEDGEHTEQLVEGEVGAFFVENDMLYYTLWDERSESYAFCCMDLTEQAEECLIPAGMTKKFACCNGMIYYVAADDGRLYGYRLSDGESERISEDEVGCYDIYNGMIYYENLSDSAICMMRLDGTQAEEIDVPFDCREPLWQLKVCPYDGSIYLAVIMDQEAEYRGNSMCLFAVDGQMELFFGDDFGNFDRRQTLYYRDGLLYYSASIAYEIRVFDFEEYFDGGGSGIRADSYDTVFCEENMNTFAVTDEFVYVQLYIDSDIIMVFDRETGELVEEIDCSDFWRYMS